MGAEGEAGAGGEVANFGGGDVVGGEEAGEGGDVFFFDREEVAVAGEGAEPFEEGGVWWDGEGVEVEFCADAGAVR